MNPVRQLERTLSLSSSSSPTMASANDLFAQHLVLISRVKEAQKAHRRKLRALPSPPLSILNLPTIPTPKPSPPGAEPERRFEEFVLSCSCLLPYLSKLRPHVVVHNSSFT